MKKHKSILFFENLHERINYNERIINKFNDLKCLLRDLDICIEKLKSEYNCNPCLLLKSKLDIYNDKRDKYVDMFNQYDKNIKKNKVLDYYNKDKDFLEIANNFNSIISSLKKIENDSKKLKCKSIFSGYMVEVYSSDGRKKYIHSSLIDEYERLFNLKKEILPLYNVKLSDYSNRYSEYYINDYFNDELFDSIKDNDSFDLDFASDLFDKYYSDMTLDEKIRYNVYTMDKILNDKNSGKKQFITVDGKKYYIPVKMKNRFIKSYYDLKKLKEVSHVCENVCSLKKEVSVDNEGNSYLNFSFIQSGVDSSIDYNNFSIYSFLNDEVKIDENIASVTDNSDSCDDLVFYEYSSKKHDKSNTKKGKKIVYEVLSVKPAKNYNRLIKNFVAISLSLVTSLSVVGVVHSIAKKYNNYDNYSVLYSSEFSDDCFNNVSYKNDIKQDMNENLENDNQNNDSQDIVTRIINERHKNKIVLPFNESNYKKGSYKSIDNDLNVDMKNDIAVDDGNNILNSNNDNIIDNSNNILNSNNDNIIDNSNNNSIGTNDNAIVNIGDIVTVREGSKIYCNVYDAMTKAHAKETINPYNMERSVIGIFIKYNHKFYYSTNQVEIDDLLSNGGVIKSYVIGNGGYEGAFHPDDMVKVKSLVR